MNRREMIKASIATPLVVTSSLLYAPNKEVVVARLNITGGASFTAKQLANTNHIETLIDTEFARLKKALLATATHDMRERFDGRSA